MPLPPLAISQFIMLLKLYIDGGTFTYSSGDMSAVINAQSLVAADLAQSNGKDLVITDRGKVYCEAIRNLSLPQAVWTMKPSA